MPKPSIIRRVLGKAIDRFLYYFGDGQKYDRLQTARWNMDADWSWFNIARVLLGHEPHWTHIDLTDLPQTEDFNWR